MKTNKYDETNSWNNTINYVNQLVNIDWLELNFTFTIPTFRNGQEYFNLTSNCFIEYTNTQSKFWANIDNLYIDDRLIGQVAYNSKQQPESNMLILKLENSLLYEKDYINYINYLINTVGMKYNHISRTDIAVDTVQQQIIPFLNVYTKQFINRKNYIKLKSHAKLEPVELSKENGKFKSFYIGSRSSYKYIRIYDKTEELQTSQKKYIKHYWKKNNLDYQNNTVERVELVVNGRKAKYIDYKQLTNPNYLASIMKTELQNYADFTYQKNNQYGKNTIVKPLVVLDDKYQIELLDNTYTPLHTDSIRSIKIILKGLFTEDLKYHSNPNNIDKTTTYVHTINQLLEEYKLKNWYEERKGFWEEDYYKKTHQSIKRIKEEEEILDAFI